MKTLLRFLGKKIDMYLEKTEIIYIKMLQVIVRLFLDNSNNFLFVFSMFSAYISLMQLKKSLIKINKYI